MTINKQKAIVEEDSLQARDGVDHINIDINGKTELGKLLSNFSKTPFVHPVYGPFISIEGFWHWIRSKKPDDALRSLYGYKAKQRGRVATNMNKIANFREEIILAIWAKVVQNDKILKLLTESDLPFKQYYVFGPKQIEICSDRINWVLEGIEKIRTHLKEHGKDTPFKY